MSFVFTSWLSAGRELSLVRGSLRGWLDLHASELPAGYVIGAWLKRGGESEIVRDGLARWMKAHGANAAAFHLNRAWRMACGTGCEEWGYTSSRRGEYPDDVFGARFAELLRRDGPERL